MWQCNSDGIAMCCFDYVEGVEFSEEECQITCSKGLHVIHDFLRNSGLE